MEETRKSHKGLAIVVTLVVLLFAMAGTVAGLALSDPYAGTVQASVQPETLVSKLASSLLSGEPALLTKEEVGGLLASQVAGLQGGGFQVLDLQCVSVEGGAAELYIPVSCSGLRLGVNANLAVGCDAETGTLWTQVQSVHIGRLPVRPEWVTDAVEKMLPGTVSVEDGRISVPSTFFDEKVLGGAVGLTVTDLQVTPEGFLVYVKGNTERLQSDFGRYLQEFLSAGD